MRQKNVTLAARTLLQDVAASRDDCLNLGAGLPLKGFRYMFQDAAILGRSGRQHNDLVGRDSA